MMNRADDKFLPFLLLRPGVDINPVCRDEITCDDPVPAIVETTPSYFGRETRVTEVKQETLDDQ